MKTALITGASSGIGKELAIIHAAKGGDLVVVARRKEHLENLKTSLEKEHNINVTVVVQDLAEPDAARTVFDKVNDKGIQVDYLINNAGFGCNDLFKDADIARTRRMMQLNMTALTDFCDLYVKQWVDKGKEGKILNVASTAAFQAVPYFTVYAATKAYVLSLSEGLALELKNDGITVTALCPGPTRTEFSGNANMDQNLAQHKLLPSGKDVAEYGYRKMLRGQTVAVHGVLNRAGANSGKLLPRKAVAGIAGRVMKKAGGH